jgi:RNA polymerase sigma factor (sigma-70 family)
MDRNDQLEKLTQNYLAAFLSFAFKRINNLYEAEELAQEIAYQCDVSISKGKSIERFDAFIWSVAHNTYKKWCMRKQPISLEGEFDTFSNLAGDALPIDDTLVKQEDVELIHLELSRLSKLYRQTLVCFYYEELSIRMIAAKLNISEEMVKFYLSKGRQKLKEAYTMNTCGEKSFNPSDFTVYKSAVDFSKVNVWEVFKRKLPCQIALICHDAAKTISELSIETGTPAVYLEDEIKLLLDAGVMISPAKDKYRTNLHILRKNAVEQVKHQFNKLYAEYVPIIISAYTQYLPELKHCDVFKYDAPDMRYAWFFSNNIADFDNAGHGLSPADYPQILSCGSKAFIFAEESKGSLWGSGSTPTDLQACTVWPRDVVIFGEYHCQKELRDAKKAQALYDVYRDNIQDADTEIYAQLIDEGYHIKRDGKMLCNVAVSTPASRELFKTINAELSEALKPLCKGIRENIYSIVDTTIPAQLRQYTQGYAETWIVFYSGVYLLEELYNTGFITLPEKNDKAPIACYIYEK